MGTKPDLAATETEIKGILRQKTIQNQLVTPEGYTRSVENEIFTFSQKKKKNKFQEAKMSTFFPMAKLCGVHSICMLGSVGEGEGNQSGKA